MYYTVYSIYYILYTIYATYYILYTVYHVTHAISDTLYNIMYYPLHRVEEWAPYHMGGSIYGIY